MRPVLFASLAFAAGISSFSSFACTSFDDYNKQIGQLQANYNDAISAANTQYAGRYFPDVVLVGLPAGIHARRYNERAAYYEAWRAKRMENWANWENSVNAARDDYTTKSQQAYNHYLRTACVWW
jgi:hypothetical protein